jgi:hypothetical protein
LNLESDIVDTAVKLPWDYFAALKNYFWAITVGD